MSGEERLWVTGWRCLAVVICVITLTVAFYNYFVNVAAFGSGYERGTLLGSEYTEWQKVAQ